MVVNPRIVAKTLKSRSPFRAATIGCTVTAVVLLLSGCQINSIFGIPFGADQGFARYAGVNLISSNGFDSGSWAVDQGATYMSFQSVAASLTGDNSQLPSGTSNAIYRLEIKNLVPDGDFESDTVGAAPATWTLSSNPPTAPPGPPDNTVITGAGAITGNSYSFNVTN